MQVNADLIEAHTLLKRTYDRVPNLSRYILKFRRANHDCSVLIDAGHKMRYAARYVSKSKKQTELMDEVIQNLGKRINDPLGPNIKQAPSHLILADCSHRSFMSKQELSYKVMDLLVARKTFNDVNIVGSYRRANLIQHFDNDVIVYSDTTLYSAYAQRCNASTICKGLEQVTE
jgi:hypothetical protein